MVQVKNISPAEYMEIHGITPDNLKDFPLVEKAFKSPSLEPVEDTVNDCFVSFRLKELKSDDSGAKFHITANLNMQFDYDADRDGVAHLNDVDVPVVYDSVTLTSRLMLSDGTVIPFSTGTPITRTDVLEVNQPIATAKARVRSGETGFLNVTALCYKDGKPARIIQMKDEIKLSPDEVTLPIEAAYCGIDNPRTSKDTDYRIYNQVKILYGRDNSQVTVNRDQIVDYSFPNNKKENDMKTLIPFKFNITVATDFKVRKDSSGNYVPLATINEIKTITGPADFKLYRPEIADLNLSTQKSVVKTFYQDANDTDATDKIEDDQAYLDKVISKFVKGGERTIGTTKYDTITVDFSLVDSDSDWHAKIGTGFINAYSYCNLTAPFRFCITDVNGDKKIIEILVSSIKNSDFPNPDATDNYYTLHTAEGGVDQYDFYIPPIFLWWGCFAEDVKIKLASGEIRRADQICVGDIVKTGDGYSATVGNVYTGTDEHIMVIVTENDRVTRVSLSHPMCTNLYENTFRAAKDLRPGDKLIQEDGSETVIRHIDKVPYGRKVYNFSFNEYEDEGCAILGDGIWSGDFIAQNTCARKAVEAAQALRDQAPQSDFSIQLEELIKASAKAQQ
ncbi:MAG: hypothetical protein LBL98_04630 [Ruminococcus sp.]|jgi:hypothetical protein|nr:hypothetical protein [Ruminococcus sp.]